MNKELINDLRLEAGISRLHDNVTLIAMTKEGAINDPLDGLEKFAELIVQECLDILEDERYNRTMLTVNPVESGAIYDAQYNIRQRFGVKR
jgi:hypothetical protein